ncbi:2'-5' RNA ligase [Deinococcus aetherius]|uniref:2'-5' RNA ligase n=1 Tax=Deinococcus aetherius TaxID=200252 RepID=A0ABN6RK07_9DEIO|nr:RNA ligase family protein [Deinococcus aetherius]BDP42606.1 2'-5' RNA ligase [Deinococcus aetherius]
MSSRVKYPRTPHLPWSPGASDDDTRMADVQAFEGHEVVVSEKLDGENTTLYRDGLHARSLDPRPHPSRDWVKGLQGRIGYLLPGGWRACGENLYARHSLAYENLASYFYLFSIWDDTNTCLSWDETLLWAEELGVPTPEELYRGPWDERLVRGLEVDEQRMEGYVVRTTVAFPFAAFSSHVAKWVRMNHVQTDEHWLHRAVVPNTLEERG